eukprot:Skav231193  [mRNA]  locus=scaffold425:241551:242408:+ [translate_table: standard]
MGNTVAAEPEIEASLPVCVLQPSGEVAFRGSVPKASTVKELVLRISDGGLGPAHRLSLVSGNEILQGTRPLEQLDRGEEELCLYLVRNARTEFIKSIVRKGEKSDWLVRCVVLGPSGVGKSALVLRYCHQKFIGAWHQTIGVEFHNIGITTKCQQFTFKVHCLDFSGLPRFRLITLQYLRGAAGIMAVFSLKSRASLHEAVSMAHEALRRFPQSDGVLVCLVGTHADSDQQEVSEEEAMAVADKLHCSYHAVSNATGEGVTEAWHDWLNQYLDHVHQRSCAKRSG